MMLQTFEIKIALLGYVSVGKTTVLNALLRDKYGEVSMRRTTAGVNYFRLFSRTSGKRSADALLSATNNENKSDDAMDWSNVIETVHTAEETLKEITLDNASLRESNIVQEKTFDIELEDDICETRSDTRLVVVDIPGINEAGASTKYKDYVAENWHSFDCVIVVMDAKQGVNTEDQVQLLHFVKQNLENKKDMPVIILGNKVDEPDDHEQDLLVSEVRSTVEDIFSAPDRGDALQAVLDGSEVACRPSVKVFPIFIPISAIHAYIYQTASLMDFEKFKSFDKDLIEKLGREVVGTRKWKRCSPDQKIQEAFNIITDSSLYTQGIEDSNFNKFLTALSHCIGGEQMQRKLIASQLQVARSLLSHDSCITTQLKSIYDRSKVLEEPVDSLKNEFWRVYDELHALVSDQYTGPTTISVLTKPMKELIEYHKWAVVMDWKDEQTRAVTKMKELVQQQMESVFNEAAAWLSKSSGGCTQATNSLTGWKDLTALDWINILESVLLLSYNKSFCSMFGKEKMFIEMLKAQLFSIHFPLDSHTNNTCPNCSNSTQCTSSGTKYCPSCGMYGISPGKKTKCPCCARSKQISNLRCSSCSTRFWDVSQDNFFTIIKYQKGKFVVTDADKYKRSMKFTVPDSVADANHFGHLAWQFCNFIESLIDN